MEQEKNEKTNSFKSYLLLTFTLFISVAVGICMFVQDDFTKDISPIVVWGYFGVVIFYVLVALFDLITNKQRGKNLKAYILIMALTNLAGIAFFLVSFLVTK